MSIRLAATNTAFMHMGSTLVMLGIAGTVNKKPALSGEVDAQSTTGVVSTCPAIAGHITIRMRSITMEGGIPGGAPR